MALRSTSPRQALRCAVEYWSPPGITGSEQVAWENCRKSAEQAEAIGRTYHAYMLSDRSFRARDEEQKRVASEEAGKNFEAAAKQNFSWALLSYGYRLEEGVGVPSDWPRAIEMYRAAQAQDVPAADYALGSMMLKGLVEGHDRLECVLLHDSSCHVGDCLDHGAGL